jgi:thiol-disulfide isomerase/thioredoxin
LPISPGIKVSKTESRVKLIDLDGLKNILKPNGRPLMINFWATWCDPCREEFPDLVRLDAAYRGKIDFLTISFDDPADINTQVPKFLTQMKAEMPAYLLSTNDENAAITMISKHWEGNLPLTMIYNPSGDTAYMRKGKISYEAVAAVLDRLTEPAAGSEPRAR